MFNVYLVMFYDGMDFWIYGNLQVLPLGVLDVWYEMTFVTTGACFISVFVLKQYFY